MSNTSKAVIGIIVLILIALGIWWFVGRSDSSATMPADSTSAAAVQAGQLGTSTSSSTVSSTDTSDAALTSDMNNVDAQMNGLNSDNASADQGLSAQNQ